MRKDCSTCIYSHWDYEAYTGGAKRWFCTGCKKGLDVPEGNCEEWEEAVSE